MRSIELSILRFCPSSLSPLGVVSTNAWWLAWGKGWTRSFCLTSTSTSPNWTTLWISRAPGRLTRISSQGLKLPTVANSPSTSKLWSLTISNKLFLLIKMSTLSSSKGKATQSRRRLLKWEIRALTMFVKVQHQIPVITYWSVKTTTNHWKLFIL